MNNFEQSISNLDIKIFEKIKSQLSEYDKRSLLACHLAVRELAAPNYNYLEIGSYLGGSIQPHLQDERCARVWSIDKRPLHQPDNRGVDYTYLNNSTKRMLELLAEVAPVDKIRTIDGDTRQIKPSEIGEKMQLCFIDGEHTDEGVISDFKFCLEVLDTNGAILFHDAPITYNAIAECVEHLKTTGVKFRAYSLPNIVFAIEIGDFPMHRNEKVLDLLTNNHTSYLYSLQFNDYYRHFANKKPFLMYRKFLTKWKGLNKFD